MRENNSPLSVSVQDTVSATSLTRLGLSFAKPFKIRDFFSLHNGLRQVCENGSRVGSGMSPSSTLILSQDRESLRGQFG